jgi:hypothetical protein
MFWPRQQGQLSAKRNGDGSFETTWASTSLLALFVALHPCLRLLSGFSTILVVATRVG